MLPHASGDGGGGDNNVDFENNPVVAAVGMDDNNGNHDNDEEDNESFEELHEEQLEEEEEDLEEAFSPNRMQAHPHLPPLAPKPCNNLSANNGNTFERIKPVYKVMAGTPKWSSLRSLAAESLASLATKSVVRAVKFHGRTNCDAALASLRRYLTAALPTLLIRDVLEICLARDRFLCHHNPTDCLALELWRVFYSVGHTEETAEGESSHVFDSVSIVHHEFAFPKTCNYPEIVRNLNSLLTLMTEPPASPPPPAATAKNKGKKVNEEDVKNFNNEEKCDDAKSKTVPGEYNEQQDVYSSSSSSTSTPNAPTTISTTSFKLELKQCEIGHLLEESVSRVIISPRFRDNLRQLELPGLASDRLLAVIASECANLEVLDVRGSRIQVTDAGFAEFVKIATTMKKNKKRCGDKLKSLNVTRCNLSQQSLPAMAKLEALAELKISTNILDDVHFPEGGGSLEPVVLYANDSKDNSNGAMRLALASVKEITVENDNSFPFISINNIMTLLRHAFPYAKNIALVNCIACELHVTLTQHPANITFMRETIHTLDLVSADYFNFPRLVYPCPNLESLHIEKPSNDVFNVDQHNIPILYDNTVPFGNLKCLKLSRISLTNLSHFLSRSRNLKKFKVTNIGRRERPKWTDERVRQILPCDSVPHLEEFHVSCLPNEGYSTTESHRYLHLTKATIQYLTGNFRDLKSIEGIESWTPSECHEVALSSVLNSNTEPASSDGKTFAIVSF